GLPLLLVLLGRLADGVQWGSLRAHVSAARGAEVFGGETGEALARSFELSLRSPQMTPEALDLLAGLARLPMGLAETDSAVLVAPGRSYQWLSLQKMALVELRDGRWRMLGPIREYVASRYPPAEATWSALQEYFITLAERAVSAFQTASGPQPIETLMLEWGNIRHMVGVAFQGELRTRSIDTTMALVSISLRVGIDLDELLEAVVGAGGPPDDLRRIRSLRARGDIASSRNMADDALRLHNEALALAQKVDRVGLEQVNCLLSLAETAFRANQHAQARAYAVRAHALVRECDDDSGLARCFVVLGKVTMALEFFDAARTYFGMALDVYRGARNSSGEVACLQLLADVERRLGNWEDAGQKYEDVLRHHQQLGDIRGQAHVLREQ